MARTGEKVAALGNPARLLGRFLGVRLQGERTEIGWIAGRGGRLRAISDAWPVFTITRQAVAHSSNPRRSAFDPNAGQAAYSGRVSSCRFPHRRQGIDVGQRDDGADAC